MTNTVEAKAFYEALKHLDIFNRRSKPGILDEVCVRFSDSICTLVATDIGNIMSVDIPAAGDAFSFAFKNTAKVMKACKYFSGLLTLTVRGEGKDMWLLMTCGEKGAEFPVSSAEDYNLDLPFEAEQSYFTKTKTLLERMKHVKYAALTYENSRPELQGFQFAGRHLYCIDGRRLALSEDDTLTVKMPFVVPQLDMSCLKEMGDADLRIDVDKRLVRFQSNCMTAMLRRIPCDPTADPARYIPKDTKETCTVNRQKYLHELSYLKECVGSKNSAVALFENGSLTVRQHESLYKAKVDVDRDCQIDYAFDVEMMRDALNQFSGCDLVEIHTCSYMAPITITAKGTGDTALVMPQHYPNAA